MVSDNRHRGKTSKSRKNFHNREKAFRIEEKFWNPEYFGIEKQTSELRKIFQNRENYFKIEKNISGSRKLFQNREKMFQNREMFYYKNQSRKIF